MPQAFRPCAHSGHAWATNSLVCAVAELEVYSKCGVRQSQRHATLGSHLPRLPRWQANTTRCDLDLPNLRVRFEIMRDQGSAAAHADAGDVNGTRESNRATEESDSGEPGAGQPGIDASRNGESGNLRAVSRRSGDPATEGCQAVLGQKWSRFHALPGQENVPVVCQLPAELRELIDAWPLLQEEARAEIVKQVRQAQGRT